jgi:hypothetical protein
MAKKINKYSWIHLMNEAALEAKLLAEAKQHSEQIQLNEARRGVMGGGYQTNRPLGNPSPEEAASHNVLRFLQDIGIPKESLARGVKDIVGIGKEIVHSPQGLATPSAADASSVNMAAYQTARGSRNLIPADVDNDGDADAEDVKKDAQDSIMDHESGRAPYYAWAHQSVAPTQVQHPPAPNFGGMTPNEITRKANQQVRADAVIDDLYSKMDSEIERRIKTAPPGKMYTVQDLQHIARMIGGR